MNMEENIMPVNGAAVTVPWFTNTEKGTAITVRYPAADWNEHKASGEKIWKYRHISNERCRENTG